MSRVRIIVVLSAVAVLTVGIMILLQTPPRRQAVAPQEPHERLVVEPLHFIDEANLETVFSQDSDLVEAPPVPVEAPREVKHRRSLSASDEMVRALVVELSTHPQVVEWVVTDGLLRRFATAVEMVAGGSSPVDQLRFLEPRRPFVVHRDEDRLVIGSASYRRYDLAAEVFASIDARRAVDLIQRLSPMISEAHRQVAWFQTDFDERLMDAIEHLLEVEVPERDLEVQRGPLTFVFADLDLEGLSDAQRHLLRMGPVNARKVQAKLRELRGGLSGEHQVAQVGGHGEPEPTGLMAPHEGMGHIPAGLVAAP